MNASPPRVLALILAGGASSRMRRDKAAVEYQGQRQLDRTCELAARHATGVFVSVRADQVDDPVRSRWPLIVDSVPGAGPIVGIRSALAHTPGAAWLVLACDLPFLSDAALAHLLGARDPGCLATAYRSAHDGLPEPLCAIWEPGAAAELADFQAGGRRCPRKFLATHRARLIEPLEPRALDNINTPEEYAEARAILDAPAGTARMQITIQYYALMREQAGRSDEVVDTRAATPADLYEELCRRHPFTLERSLVKVAVNGEFRDWTHTLASGDSVVFIPPVAGG
ncbi:MAG: NTP transferase domain-containing protein [Gammaproteobacteria bacterium]|nr:NTP transferase domain-containing protein [Gammaproteobacteria bacterium]